MTGSVEGVMANTYSSLFYHVVFSTKQRTKFIRPEIEQRVWAYLGGVASRQGAKTVQIGGMEDHVHVLLMAPPKVSPAELVRRIKGDSSRWIHEVFPELRNFGWQDGYGVFSVSRSNVPQVVKYIQNQREHHRVRTFQEEYLLFLKKHQVAYDERYVWG
jgi:putative transposase